MRTAGCWTFVLEAAPRGPGPGMKEMHRQVSQEEVGVWAAVLIPQSSAASSWAQPGLRCSPFSGAKSGPPIVPDHSPSPTEAPAHAGASDSEHSLWLGLPVCLQHHHGQHTQQGGRRAGGRQLPSFFQPYAPGCRPLETGAD